MGVTSKVWFAFLGAAAAWSVQLLAGSALLAHACYPQIEPLRSPTAGGFRGAAAAITIVALLVALVALRMAWRLVVETEGRRMGFAQAAAIADDDGIPRYLAFAGVLVGIVFTLLIVFNGIALILEATCRFA
jgi:hypothetical protein